MESTSENFSDSDEEFPYENPSRTFLPTKDPLHWGEDDLWYPPDPFDQDKKRAPRQPVSRSNPTPTVTIGGNTITPPSLPTRQARIPNKRARDTLSVSPLALSHNMDAIWTPK